MKKTAKILNFIMIGWIFFNLIAEGLPKGDDLLVVILFIAVPLCNLFALSTSTGDNWFDLLLKRKALEEKKKIESLIDKTK